MKSEKWIQDKIESFQRREIQCREQAEISWTNSNKDEWIKEANNLQQKTELLQEILVP